MSAPQKLNMTLVLITLIGAIPATISAFAAVAAWNSSKETHLSVNSRMDTFQAEQKAKFEELLKVATEAARAEGRKEEKDNPSTR